MAAPWIPTYDGVLTRTSTIKNTGASVSYLRWVIVGPGFYLKLNNVTTSKNWALNYHIRDGDTVTINFDPTKRSVVSAYDGSVTNLVTSSSEYWSLGLGDNSVYVELGWTTSATRITAFHR